MKPFALIRNSAEHRCTIGRAQFLSHSVGLLHSYSRRCGTRITIHTPDDGASELDANREFQRAFVVLHHALIHTRGGGRFADDAAAIILATEADVSRGLIANGGVPSDRSRLRKSAMGVIASGETKFDGVSAPSILATCRAVCLRARGRDCRTNSITEGNGVLSV
jgi:hypothetical protein